MNAALFCVQEDGKTVYLFLFFFVGRVQMVFYWIMVKNSLSLMGGDGRTIVG
jgi:hypothetical protein